MLEVSVRGQDGRLLPPVTILKNGDETPKVKAERLDGDMEVVADTVVLAASDLAVTAETVNLLLEMVLELQEKVAILEGGNA